MLSENYSQEISCIKTTESRCCSWVLNKYTRFITNQDKNILKLNSNQMQIITDATIQSSSAIQYRGCSISSWIIKLDYQVGSTIKC